MTGIIDAIYMGALAIIAPALALRAMARGEGRIGIRQRFGAVPARKSSRQCVWVHAASVGEVVAVQPLVNLMEKELRGWEIAVSTMTRTGLATAAERFPDGIAFLHPYDLSWVVERTISRVRPDLLLLVETELWPNLIWCAARRRVPVALVNGSISSSSYRFYRCIGPVMRAALSRLSCCCVQSEADAERFRSLGVPQDVLEITGNMKYDSGFQVGPADCGAGLRQRLGFGAEHVILLAGSTHEGEEEAVLWAFARLLAEHAGLRLVLGPRHPGRFAAVEELVSGSGLSFAKWSAIRTADRPLDDPPLVLLVDTIGDLARLYALGDIVFVGGSLVPVGGHNLIEPAMAGRPVLFGPHVWSCRDMADVLVSSGGGTIVNDAREFAETVRRLVLNAAGREEMGTRARSVVEANRGATARNWKALLRVVGTRVARPAPAVS